MGSTKNESVSFAEPADVVFQSALGVAQNTKNAQILAVQNEGRILIYREKSMMSNRKFVAARVDDNGGSAQLHVSVMTDPRANSALMDGKFNQKSLNNFVENIRAALDGSNPAPVTPVSNHYMQKKDQVAWDDPTQDPDIELDGNARAALLGF